MKFWAVGYLATVLRCSLLTPSGSRSWARRLYRPILGDILLDQFRLAPACVFYFLYVLAIVVFAISLPRVDWKVDDGADDGRVPRLVCYGTYDLTTMQRLRRGRRP